MCVTLFEAVRNTLLNYLEEYCLTFNNIGVSFIYSGASMTAAIMAADANYDPGKCFNNSTK